MVTHNLAEVMSPQIHFKLSCSTLDEVDQYPSIGFSVFERLRMRGIRIFDERDLRKVEARMNSLLNSG